MHSEQKARAKGTLSTVHLTGKACRGRVLQVAYDLFCREGINAFSVEELVPAVLDLREKLWRVDWLEAEVERRATPGKARLLAIFDLFDEWFRRDDYEGASSSHAPRGA